MKYHTKLLLALITFISGGACLAICASIGGLTVLGPAIFEGLLSRSSFSPGAAAPDFELDTLAGSTLKLSDLRGQPVLLAVGTSWCPPCREEAPFLQKLHDQGSNLVVVMLDTQEELQTVQAYADELGLTLPIALDYDGAVARAYRVWGYPTSFLIDENGIVRGCTVGELTETKLAAMLDNAGIEP